MSPANPYLASPELAAVLDSKRTRSLIVGLIGIAACIAGYFTNREQFFHSYLVAYVFWMGLALGGLVLAMMAHTTGGAWGVMIRRINEAAAAVMPLMFVASLPLFFGMRDLYEWARPEVVANDPILTDKLWYLNFPHFYIRQAADALVWLGMAFALRYLSTRQDKEGAMPFYVTMQRISSIGLVIYVLSVTFWAIDWVMSLDPHWYSTIYGLLFVGGQGFSSFAFSIYVLILLAQYAPMRDAVTSKHLHDLGKLQFAFVMLWAYFNFSQYIIIWSANLPEENPWYLTRMQGGWQYVSIVMILFHFALPFMLLLSRDIKKNPNRMKPVVLFLMFIQLVDVFWLAAPSHMQKLTLHWLDIAAPVALGGLWLWNFYGNLKQRPLLPLNEPHLQEALQHGRHH